MMSVMLWTRKQMEQKVCLMCNISLFSICLSHVKLLSVLTGTRRPWTKEELVLLLREFGSYDKGITESTADAAISMQVAFAVLFYVL
jgi:hypothetical protein